MGRKERLGKDKANRPTSRAKQKALPDPDGLYRGGVLSGTAALVEVLTGSQSRGSRVPGLL